MSMPDVPIPQPAAKGAYDAVALHPVANLFDEPLMAALGRLPVTFDTPLTFEALGQRYGFVLYEATAPSYVTDPALLQVPGIADRAIVFVDSVSGSRCFLRHTYSVGLLESV